jgi:polyribonucleotide nucleotidyltransferase|tara:strand:+ start:553 stop:2739 length:2187 start_codon:yes stop_codon:yes gene_type:complete
MTKEIKKSMELGGRTLTLETGTMARQSAGSILLTYGETVILVAVNSSSSPREGIDFFPLSVEYRERGYAAGKIPGGYFKREGRPTEKEILAARLTDRPIRPLFPEGFRCETQIFINLLSTDQENPADTLGTIGTSVALMSSDIPWNGPIAAVRVGLVNDKMILNPTYEQIDDSKIDMVVTGNEESIIMMEGESKEASEDEIFSAVQYAHEAIKDIIKFQIEFSSELSIEKREFDIPQIDADLETKTNENIGKRMTDILKIQEKGQRKDAQSDLTNELIESMEEEFPDQDSVIRKLVTAQYKKELRSNLLKEIRVDGRNMDEIRPISIKLGFLPRTHGSSLFTRGETQSLCTITLGSKSDEQYVDDIDGEFKKKYMLHYNFPPFSVGEIKRYLGLSRREVGHGNLAERALKSILPKFEDFPYTIRVVSDILESNGSSSMASVCAGSLALMDAGVPIISPVAGVTVGLVKDGKKEVLFSDILGEEDHFGDMDFKVAGTRKGITSIQVDLKIDGISQNLIAKILDKAKTGRMHILGLMKEAIDGPNSELSDHAPKIVHTVIDTEKIGELIGPGGRNIRNIIKESGCDVEVDDDGIVVISSQSAEDCARGKYMVEMTVKEPEVGLVFEGKVRRITNFGAFVELVPGKEGLLHISEIAYERTNKVEDVLKIDQTIEVKVIELGEFGKFGLSMKALKEPPEGYVERPRKPRNDRGGRPNHKRNDRGRRPRHQNN